MKHALFLALTFAWLSSHSQEAADLRQEITSYVQPLELSNNFAGQVLISIGENIIYKENFGMADREYNVPVTDKTTFQIASVSKSFTAAAIVKLAEDGKLQLDQTLNEFIEDYPRGDEISIHHLLTHTSGIPNINNLAIYSTLEKAPHSAESLIVHYKKLPLEFAPGSQYRYSNSNYNLLAFIIESVSDLTYGEYLDQIFFTPLRLSSTGHPGQEEIYPETRATGYVPVGVSDVESARQINWSVKTGNGSLFSNAVDLAKWSHAFFNGLLVSQDWVSVMTTEHSANVGYGFFIRPRLGLDQININGRSPGFSSVISYYPDKDLLIVILSNLYVPVATQMSIDIASIVFDKPVKSRVKDKGAVEKTSVLPILGQYQFGPDFYQPNKVLTVTYDEGFVNTDWGELLAGDNLSFIHRYYWIEVTFSLDEEGRWIMNYDGYKGQRIAEGKK